MSQIKLFASRRGMETIRTVRQSLTKKRILISISPDSELNCDNKLLDY